MEPKRPPKAATPEAAPTAGTARIGFSPEARAIFDKLPPKVQTGIRRKLFEFAANPAIGKPLVGPLLGYRRVTYARYRTIAMHLIANVARGVVLVHVVEIGLRKQGSEADPYELAIESLRRGDADAQEALELLVQELQAQDSPDTREAE